MEIYFVTGIGTGVGKTLVSTVLVNALQADYWKPVQAGLEEPDSAWVRQHLYNSISIVHPPLYNLQLPASPHIAARKENIQIDLERIVQHLPLTRNKLIVEGAGGLMVPLNDHQFMADLAKRMGAKLILVSRNYLGSINHSLLTAAVCKQYELPVAGWIFNDQYLNYEDEIVQWSGIPRLGSVAAATTLNKSFIVEQSALLKACTEGIL
jgi:dethiobiotin synthetase